MRVPPCGGLESSGMEMEFYFCSDGDEGRVAWGRQIRMDGRIPPPRRLPPPPKMPVAAKT